MESWGWRVILEGNIELILLPPLFSSQIPDFQAINTPWGATLEVLGVNPKFRTCSIHTVQPWKPTHGWGAWKWWLSTDMALFLFNSKIQPGNEGNVCLVVFMPQSMSFHQNPPTFSGRIICKHSQKQLTQPGFVNASCPCLFVLGAAQILFAEFLVKLGLLIPESWSWLSLGNAVWSQDILMSGITGVGRG